MKETYIVKQANITNLDALLDLLHQLSPVKKGGDFTDYKKLQKILHKIITNENYCLCTCVYKGKIVGTATLLIQLNLSHCGQPYAHIENVVTDQAQRGKSIGLRMVEYLVQQARDKNCYKIILDCARYNIPFYKKCGFIETGEVEMRI